MRSLHPGSDAKSFKCSPFLGSPKYYSNLQEGAALEGPARQCPYMAIIHIPTVEFRLQYGSLEDISIILGTLDEGQPHASYASYRVTYLEAHGT